MPPVSSGPFGAYTPQAAANIQAALAQAGLGTTGNVFYLDPVNGFDGNSGQQPAPTGVGGQGPVQSLAKGYALLRSGYNDVLVLIGNGAASGSARIVNFTWAKNAAHLIGVCAPSAISQRARIANATTSGLTLTAGFFTVSGNGCLFQNVSWFHGAGAGQTGIAGDICMTVSGSRNAFINCDIEGMGDSTSATSTTSRNLKITAGENYFKHCNIGLDTVTRTGANSTVEISGNAARNIFEDCTFPIYSSDGAQFSFLAAAAAAIDRFTLFKNCTFINSLGSGSTIQAELLHIVASSGGIVVFDTQTVWMATATGDATTKTQLYMAGTAATSTTGGKAIVAT
jgi:hypothetical protein